MPVQAEKLDIVGSYFGSDFGFKKPWSLTPLKKKPSIYGILKQFP